MTTKTEERQEVEVVMVYLGVRRHGYKPPKKVHLWQEVDGVDGEVPAHEDDAGIFSKALQNGATPGSVYRFKGSRPLEGPGLSITLQSGEWLGTFEDQDKVARWQLRHKGATMAHQAASKQKQEQRKRLDLARLEPLRHAYMLAKHNERHHILAEVIRAVTSSTPIK